jgi:bacteriocin-type transport-associated protein
MKYLPQLERPSTWSITTKISTAMLLATIAPISLAVYYKISWQNGTSAIGIGAIASIISLLLARNMTQPLRTLTKAGQILERGHFALGFLAKVSRTPNDIGQLARVFLQMAEEIQRARSQKPEQPVKETLLQELSNSDINWLLATGRRTEITTGNVLDREGKAAAFHIVLDGILTATVSQGKSTNLEIARLPSGEVIGESFFIGNRAIAPTIKAVENSLLLSIPRQQLAEKLERDAGFAARFYRAIAILLSDRLHNLIGQLSRKQLVRDQPLKDLLFVLGELNDSDIDWLISTGTRQKIAANEVLIHEGGTVDALYILLNGTTIVSIAEKKCNPLTLTFGVREGCETSSLAIAQLSRGEIFGETPFIDGRLPFARIEAVEDSLVLSIPRQQLAAKLQQDIGFSSRFYRAIATLVSSRLQEMLSRLGYIKPVDSKSQSLNGAIESEDELDFSVLDQMAMAGTKFDWMLKRLKVI